MEPINAVGQLLGDEARLRVGCAVEQAPQRLVDTREGGAAAPGAGSVVVVPVLSKPGVPTDAIAASMANRLLSPRSLPSPPFTTT